MRLVTLSAACAIAAISSAARADVVVTGSVTDAEGRPVIGATIQAKANNGTAAVARALVTAPSFRLTLAAATTSIVCEVEANGYARASLVRPVEDATAAAECKIKLRPWVSVKSTNVVPSASGASIGIEALLQSSDDAPQTTFSDVELTLPIPPLRDGKCSGADKEVRFEITDLVRAKEGDGVLATFLEAGGADGPWTASGSLRASECEEGELRVTVPRAFGVPAKGGTLKYNLTFPARLADARLSKAISWRACAAQPCLTGRLRFRGGNRVVGASAEFPITASKSTP